MVYQAFVHHCRFIHHSQDLCAVQNGAGAEVDLAKVIVSIHLVDHALALVEYRNVTKWAQNATIASLHPSTTIEGGRAKIATLSKHRHPTTLIRHTIAMFSSTKHVKNSMLTS